MTMDKKAIEILRKHGCLYMKDDYKELFEELENYYLQSLDKPEVKKTSWSDVKDKYLQFHKIDNYSENMSIDIDFGFWLLKNYLTSKHRT
jgi:tRNA G46 methylase TrmB